MDNRQRNYEPDIEPETRPNLRALPGRGESTPERGNLNVVNDTSSDLKNRESTAQGLHALPGGGESTPERGNLNVVRAGEATPFTSNVTAPSVGAAAATNAVKKLPFIKKAGPVGGIIASLLGVFIWSALFSPAVLLVNLKETLVGKFDTQQISANTRMEKVMKNKLVSFFGKAACNVAEYTCRISTPSNYMLKRMNANGIEALDASGNPIAITTDAYPKEVPAQYRFTASDGGVKTFPADQVPTEFKNNASFRAAFHDSWNPKTAFYDKADTAFKQIMAKFGFGKSDVVANATDTTTAKEEINADVTGEDVGAKAATQEGAAAEESFIKKLFNGTVSDIFDKIAQSTKTSGVVGLVAGGVCIAGDIPGLVATTARTYQMAQIIKLAMVYLVVADAIKAGNATPAEVGALGGMLTAVLKDSKGNIVSNAATDSQGMKYAFGFLKGGSTKTSVASHSLSYFQPGGNVVKALGPVLKVTQSSVAKDACAVATSPVTGAALDTVAVGGSEFLGITLAIQGANIALGYALGWAIGKIMPPIINLAVSAIPVQSIMKYFMGDFTQNLDSESTGNAYASGAANMMALTANAGGNMPMTVNQAVAYADLGHQQELAYAQEDRLTHSPFDVTDQNTFLGSIVAQLVPYYSKVSSLTDVFSTVGSVFTGSLSNAMRMSVAGASSVSAGDFFGCNDPNLTKGNLAVGPFCNVYYGIPTQYLGKSPDDVLNDLSGQIDPQTGDPLPKSDLAAWTTLCTDGSDTQASNCKITTPQEADYALYTVDHRIQVSMDGQGTANTGGSATTASTGSPQNGAMIGDVGKQYLSCAAWIDQFVLPTYFGIQNPGGNGKDAVPNLGKMGYTVNHTPAVHAIVSWPAGGVAGSPADGTYGHVAIVYRVNADGSIEVEEHNYTYPNKYDTRHIDASAASLLMYAHTESKFKAP